jgi:2,4-dienoyl-CoA reductase-like NADH-dependent reductase (Old Yellow Enzyme family)
VAVSISPLFSPLALGRLRLRNRVVMAPMTRGRCPSGVPTDEVVEYYRRRAEGEVGLIITEGVGVDHPAALGYYQQGPRGLAQPVLHGASAVDAWSRVVAAVHRYGGLIAPQLWHQGPMRAAGTGPCPDMKSCSPSGIWGAADGDTALPAEVVRNGLGDMRPMTESDIADTIAAFGHSARNAKAAGFDAVAIHAAHGYLIDAFFWSVTNRRTDAWGGSARHRARFGAEVVREIRRSVGGQLPIIVRFSQWKQSDFNASIADTPDELEQLLRVLVDAGTDVFDASARRYSEPAFPAFNSRLSLAGWTRQLTGKPTIAVGSIGLEADLHATLFDGRFAASASIADAAARLSKREFDLIAVGRALLADAEWTRKIRLRQRPIPFTPEAVRVLA